jgi:hypothetical protein
VPLSKDAAKFQGVAIFMAALAAPEFKLQLV